MDKDEYGITLTLLHRCNLDCYFCYIHGIDGHGQTSIAKKDIIDKLPENIKSVLVTGGEPTIHPQFAEMWERLWNISDSIALGTNGVLLEREDVSKTLEMYPPDSISISAHLYGPQIMSKKIEYIRNRFGNDIAIYLNFVLLPHNKTLLKKYLESEEIPSDIVIKILYPMPTFGKTWMPLEEYISTAFQIIEESDIKHKFGFSNMLAAIIDKEYHNRFNGGCDVLRYENLYRIGPDGDVYLCMFLPKRTYVGNVYTDTWGEIKERRKEVVKKVWKPGPDCEGCPFVNSCSGGCAAIRHTFGGERCGMVRKILGL